MQLNALNQFISLNTTSGIANLAVEPNTGGSSNSEVIFGYGHLNASDRRLKTNIRRVPEQHVQRLFDEVEPQYYDRIGGAKDQLGFIAQDVQAAGKLGETLCKTMSGEEQLLALDYQKLWGEVPAEAGGEIGLDLACEAVMKRASEHNLVVLLDKWSACWKQRGCTRASGPLMKSTALSPSMDTAASLAFRKLLK